MAIDLVMPMAGRGSRFSKIGFSLPKPLIPLDGKPFFWWAIQSVRRVLDIGSLTCVVLTEHVERHGIDREILARFSGARIVALPQVTGGALETALAGCATTEDGNWVIINDCDHAFCAEGLAAALPAFPSDTAGFLCHFRSNSPAYSYAAYDGHGTLLHTVEKQPISDLAIAGAYGFRDRATFRRHAERYTRECSYPELFMSGVYNTLVAAGGVVRGVLLDEHLSFGTPDEYRQAVARVGAFRAWHDDARQQAPRP